MTAEEVAQFFRTHPQFFDQHLELLESVFVPHPYGGRAIPLSERQILALRDKVKLLEGKLGELIQFGEENDAVGEKMHRLCLALFPAGDVQGTLQALYYNLREDFAVPHAVVRVWRPGPGALAGSEFAPVSDELRQYAGSLEHPFCGPGANAEVAPWFGEAAAQLRSFACMPLRDGGNACVGMLALASEDPTRFYPEMGTLYLKRLGELASAALQRYW